MTDLLKVLPHFPTGHYASLIPALEKHQVTTSDLLTLDIADIGKRTQLPLLDLKRLSAAVLNALHSDLGVSEQDGPKKDHEAGEDDDHHAGVKLRRSPADLQAQWATISTLDDELDRALGGGIPKGYVTEITGESGAGKTQLLLSLLMAVQLPPPRGLGRPALYISTEAPLSTRRLAQMLAANPLLQQQQGDEGAPRPSLDNILSAATPDLESQDHILTFQVPVEVARRNVGLVVLDSVAANFRAEFERSAGQGQQGSNMGARSTELVRLGMLLRDLARRHDLAVVVANQVADRFGGGGFNSMSSQGGPPPSSLRAASTPYHQQRSYRVVPSQESPLASRSKPPAGPLPAVEPSSSMADQLPRSSVPEELGPPPPMLPPPLPDSGPPPPPALMLDHQQRWFTGWGDDPSMVNGLKTPSLGLVWSTQIAMRIALSRAPVYGSQRQRLRYDEEEEGDGAGGVPRSAVGMPAMRTWRRWMKVVFAPHVPPTGPGVQGAVEFEVTMGGLRAVPRQSRKG
ncbi:DNA repair protein rhp57 [Pleurostoma richardsiae]|uniref:DNA repair protein rhp57 n=1 Tax=Pleurostoma richardsiae TaxID=41990 RepID=A0AA38R7Z0_9PEZI|nr:DNA repair protein rhp57 [Pleurostoma richardsiae]